MQADPRISITPWMEPMNQACRVKKGIAVADVTWPSGRTTPEMIAGDVVFTDVDRVRQSRPEQIENLERAKTENLYRTIQRYMLRYERGYWIRESYRGGRMRRRVKPYVSLQWRDLSVTHAS